MKFDWREEHALSIEVISKTSKQIVSVCMKQASPKPLMRCLRVKHHIVLIQDCISGVLYTEVISIQVNCLPSFSYKLQHSWQQIHSTNHIHNSYPSFGSKVLKNCNHTCKVPCLVTSMHFNINTQHIHYSQCLSFKIAKAMMYFYPY